MTAIDRRIAVRRHTVREAGARIRLRQVLVAMAFLLAVGLIALLLQSPVMAIRQVEVSGAERSDVAAILQRYDVVVGVPTISVRADDIEATVEADPWVAKAQATISWPGTVSIVVLEHEPVAWVEIGDDWFRASGSGVILEESTPSKKGARVRLNGLGGKEGTILKGKRSLAALEFLTLLPAELRRNAVVTAGGAGTLVARIRGHLVDLGSPVDMAEKAAALTAVIEQGIPKRAAISLVSPTRPAIRNSQQVVEG